MTKIVSPKSDPVNKILLILKPYAGSLSRREPFEQLPHRQAAPTHYFMEPGRQRSTREIDGEILAPFFRQRRAWVTSVKIVQFIGRPEVMIDLFFPFGVRALWVDSPGGAG